MLELAPTLTINGPVVTLGAVTGVAYGLLGVGLVLVHRATGVINVAQAQIGVLGTALLAVAVNRWGLPYWLMLPVALAAAGAISSLVDPLILSRLRRAPAVMTLVALLGAGQVMSQAAQAFAGEDLTSFPSPPGLPSLNIGALVLTPAHMAALALGPLLVAGIGLFLRRSTLGLGLRAASDNADAARAAGIPAARMRMLAWALAGVTSALAAALVLPNQATTSASELGPGLLVRGLAAALLARTVSLPVALGAGMGIGVLEQIVLWNFPQSQGVVDVVLFFVVAAAMLLQRDRHSRAQVSTSWLTTRPWEPLTDAQRRHWVLRHLALLTGVTLCAATALAAVLSSNATALVLVTIAGFSVVGLSVGLLTGLAGQVSLGQFAVAAAAATVSAHVAAGTGNIPLAIATAMAAGVVLNVVAGLPAVRGNALMLTVTTLAFAVAADAWLLRQPWALGEGMSAGQPVVGTFAFDTGRSYLVWSLGILTVCLLLAGNIRRSLFGTAVIATRDNPAVAASFGIRTTSTRVALYAAAGLLAGLGGGLLAHAADYLDPSVFPAGASIDVIAMSALGGINLLIGPLIGALYVVGVPRFLPLDSAAMAATSLGWLLLVMYFPAGLAQLVAPARAALIRWVTRHDTSPEAPTAASSTGPGESPTRDAGHDAGPDASPGDGWPVGDTSPGNDAPSTAAATPPAERQPSTDLVTGPAGSQHHAAAVRATSRGRSIDPVIRVRDAVVRHGGVTALNHLSVDIAEGACVGLIGPNGAGKTSLFEAIAGFTPLHTGSVHYNGHDVTTWSPARRAHAGLVRSFQDAALFSTLTVRDVLAVPAAAHAPALTSVFGQPRRRKAARAAAEETISLFGLGPHADATVATLSTGTRRLVDLAAMTLLQPRVLLLDEPSSGVAQKEVEQLAVLLRRLREDLHLTMLVVEHDMQLVGAISDRVIAMQTGSIICDGSAQHVLADPVVIEAYLGTDQRAIHRSTTTPAQPAHVPVAEAAASVTADRP